MLEADEVDTDRGIASNGVRIATQSGPFRTLTYDNDGGRGSQSREMRDRIE